MANCACPYSYGGLTMSPQPFSDLMQEITTLVFEQLNMPLPNSCNLNLYSDGLQSVGWHDDDEALFQSPDVRIISLSLGRSRRFDIVHKENLLKRGSHFRYPRKQEPDNIIPVDLNSGDLLIMAGRMQQFYEHRVAPDHSSMPRINLTWRYIVSHVHSCPRFNPEQSD